MAKLMFVSTQDTNTETLCRNWSKSLCRNVVLLIFRILRKIQQRAVAEDDLDLPVLDRKSYFFSEPYFCITLATTMMAFRRKEGDNSPAIVWQTFPSQMYKPSRSRQDVWLAVPLILDIDTTTLSPQSLHAGTESSLEGDINFPFCNLLQGVTNTYNGSSMMHCKISAMKLLAIRFLKFTKLAMPSWKMFADRDRERFTLQFKIKDGLYLHHFFFHYLQYNSYLKFVYNYSDLFERPKRKSRKVGKVRPKVDSAVMANAANWDLKHAFDGRSFNYSSMFEYEGVGGEVERAADAMNKAISEDKERGNIVTSTMKATCGAMTPEYFEYGFRFFKDYLKDEVNCARDRQSPNE